MAQRQAGLFGCANGLVGWLVRDSPSVWQQVGKAVQLNVVIGGLCDRVNLSKLTVL